MITESIQQLTQGMSRTRKIKTRQTTKQQRKGEADTLKGHEATEHNMRWTRTRTVTTGSLQSAGNGTWIICDRGLKDNGLSGMRIPW